MCLETPCPSAASVGLYYLYYIWEQEQWEPIIVGATLISVKAAFAEDPAKELKVLPFSWPGVGLVEKVVEGLLPFS